MMVPNCPFLLCWCHLIVFLILVPNCLFAFLVPNCLFAFLVPNCPGAKLSGAKLSYHQCIYIFIYDTGIPSLQVSKDLQQAVNTEGIKSCERFCQCRWLCAPEEAPSWTLGDEKSLVSQPTPPTFLLRHQITLSDPRHYHCSGKYCNTTNTHSFQEM